MCKKIFSLIIKEPATATAGFFCFPEFLIFLEMLYKFSQNLRNQIIEYFWKCHNLTISEEQADEYLDSLAELFITFNSMRE